MSNGRAKRGRRTNDGDEEEGVFLISYLDCRRDTTFVMGRYEWDWERLGRLNFEIPLIASPPSPLYPSGSGVRRCGPSSLHFLIQPLRESNPTPARLPHTQLAVCGAACDRDSLLIYI